MDEFKTVAFLRKVELSFKQPCEIISSFFEPKWRILLYPWWKADVLAQPEGSGLDGLIQRVLPPTNNEGGRILLTVHEHNSNPIDWAIYYSVFWGDYELQQIRINCLANSLGGTDVLWTERIAGFGGHGIKPVREFVETKCLESRVVTYRNAIEAYLTGVDPSTFNGHLNKFDNGVVPHEKSQNQSNSDLCF